MKTINIGEYRKEMGTLIDVRDKSLYLIKHIEGSINIPFRELIFNHNKYLNKQETYYLICDKGNLSKRACNILSIYGYSVVNVIK